jgi:hypothetical protein
MNKLLMLGLLGLMSCELSLKKVSSKFEVGDCLGKTNESTIYKIKQVGIHSYLIEGKCLLGCDTYNFIRRHSEVHENFHLIDCFDGAGNEH